MSEPRRTFEQMSSAEGAPRRGRGATWARLLRVPNLLTVPGDPAIGAVLAVTSFGLPGGGASEWLTPDRMGAFFERLGLAMLVSLLVYCAGLLLNDWFDARTDREERPTRPIPAGDVRPGTVAAVAVVLLLVALALAGSLGRACLIAAVLLVIVVVGYDALLKRIAVLGPIAMALCRVGSVLLGAAAFGWPAAGVTDAPPASGPLVLPAAGAMGAYILSISLLAVGEAKRQRLLVRAWLPSIVIGVVLGATTVWGFVRSEDASDAFAAGVTPWISVYLFAWMTVRTIYFSKAVSGRVRPETVQQAVGLMIRGVLIVQAALLVGLAPPTAGLLAFAAAYVLFFVSQLAGRWFYSS